MTSFTVGGRWYITSLILLVLVLVWDVATRLQTSRAMLTQQFEANFKQDASRREGMRDLLARDVRDATQYALARLSSLNDADTDDARRLILEEAFTGIGFALKHPRYEFFETYLVEETPDGDLLLRGRYPTDAPTVGMSVANTPLFSHVDLSSIELFENAVELNHFEESVLLKISEPQPVLIATRLIFEDDAGLSRWFMVHRVAFADMHKRIDSIGQQMVGGTTPMRIANFDARDGECQLVWDTLEGLLGCDEVKFDQGLSYRTTYNSNASNMLTYSVYLPNDAYVSARMPKLEQSSTWRSVLPIILGIALLITTAAYYRYRITSAGVLQSVTDSLLTKDLVNASIHDMLSNQFEIMRQLVFAIRDRDIPVSERRYFDIAISEFILTTLSLNTLRLENPPESISSRLAGENIDLKQLTSLARTVLEVSTIDTSIDARFLSADDLPDTILGDSFSVQTALLAAITLSSETTDAGRIELSLWTEDVGGTDCLNVRIIDSGVGWGLRLDQAPLDSLEHEVSPARRALQACLTHTVTALIHQDERIDQNEYHLRLCRCNPGD